MPILWKEKFVSINDASRAHRFSYHRLLDIKHMVIVTYFSRGNPLSPHSLLFPISSKGSFIYTFPWTGQHIPQSLMDQFANSVDVIGCLLELSSAVTHASLVRTPDPSNRKQMLYPVSHLVQSNHKKRGKMGE